MHETRRNESTVIAARHCTPSIYNGVAIACCLFDDELRFRWLGNILEPWEFELYIYMWLCVRRTCVCMFVCVELKSIQNHIKIMFSGRVTISTWSKIDSFIRFHLTWKIPTITFAHIQFFPFCSFLAVSKCFHQLAAI